MTGSPAFSFGNLRGASVAVVGCGTYPLGLGLGARIDACDYVLRANRAWATKGIESDYGRRTDLLGIGSPFEILPTLPQPRPFPVCVAGGRNWRRVDRHIAAVKTYGVDLLVCEKEWAGAWARPSLALTGTFLAVFAAHHGCASLLLVGIDLYRDKPLTNPCPVFVGHSNIQGSRFIDLSADSNALASLSSKTRLEWVRP